MRATLGTILVALCTAPVALAQGQSPFMNGLRALTQRQARNIIDAAEEMPPEKYGFKPTPAQMSFGDVIAHLVKEGNDYLCGAASGQKAPDRGPVTGTDPKDKLVTTLKASFDFCQTAFANLQDAQMGDSVDFFGGHKQTKAVAALITLADWADHYSQLAIYLRLNGLLPPTAKKS